VLNVIYYPVSAILWLWHQVFALLLGDSSAAGWALSIVLLVFTLRALLLRPAIAQFRSMARMSAIAPQIAAIRKRYAGDRQRQIAETSALQREHGVSSLGGCLPALLQVPVFIGLNHVLRAFAQHPHQPNYVFPLSEVHSYLDATLFGAHLGDAIVTIGLVGGSAAGHVTWTWGVAPVAIPLMIIAAVATHVTARLSTAPGSGAAAQSSAASIVRRLSLWVFPLGVLVFGAALPVGLLIYWVSNNIWTLMQQRLVLARMVPAGRQPSRAEAQAVRPRPPRPGQKPLRHKRHRS
jgi:YidC/Oxa1 family membrane protein insertase